MMIKQSRTLQALAAAWLLSGCAGLMPPTQVSADVAPAWQAPLPHQGKVGTMAQWWQRQGDPLLVELIVQAQGVSPSVSQALASIESARANQASANAALLPDLSAQASASRGVSQPNLPLATTLQVGLQASWELDLVGANRAVSNAAQAQLEGTQAQWHDARVSVAAEVASLYYSYHTCQGQLALARRDFTSRQQTARLTEINAKAGFVAPSVAAMARAGAAEANNRLTQQSAQCDLDIKGLVALTALGEPDVKKKMTLAHGRSQQFTAFNIANVPAQTISQRPDVFAAERNVVLASAQVGSAKAQRWPRLSLNGSIGTLRVSSGGVDADLATWSFGPLALSVPLYDAGQRSARVEAANASYQAAVSAYQGKVRQAVREVEEALVKLHSVELRSKDVQVSSRGFAESLTATQKRFNQGLASLIELEDARRSALSAEASALALNLERRLIWVALYRALGGGFEPGQLAVPATVTSSAQ